MKTSTNLSISELSRIILSPHKEHQQHRISFGVGMYKSPETALCAVKFSDCWHNTTFWVLLYLYWPDICIDPLSSPLLFVLTRYLHWPDSLDDLRIPHIVNAFQTNVSSRSWLSCWEPQYFQSNTVQLDVSHWKPPVLWIVIFFRLKDSMFTCQFENFLCIVVLCVECRIKRTK